MATRPSSKRPRTVSISDTEDQRLQEGEDDEEEGEEEEIWTSSVVSWDGIPRLQAERSGCPRARGGRPGMREAARALLTLAYLRSAAVRRRGKGEELGADSDFDTDPGAAAPPGPGSDGGAATEDQESDMDIPWEEEGDESDGEVPWEDAGTDASRGQQALLVAAGLAEEPMLGDELAGVGSVDTEKYKLSVCLGDRIPEETVAARVNSSRLETAPEWREFLDGGQQGLFSEGFPLDTLLQCPCCLGVLRRPVGLPCGHSLCRACLISLPCPGASRGPGGAAAPGADVHPGRRCPLCRAPVPRMRLRVNESLDTVTEALQVFKWMEERRQSLAPAATAAVSARLAERREPPPADMLRRAVVAVHG